ncbi:L,D-transpeptidase family protein [Sphingobacterium spiritivorum]|uniref:L,D-transpeptidase family protein n=1 Tax=Sphingobacterium spiritivorum TaxID=258 RepID=UPI0019198314|nr:L,D-transpeptidase family protein [Sphingobacterium spiritivorum]QQT25865.1 L,D-transpeptidase family protein [Sphingobacterium spiritivorum]
MRKIQFGIFLLLGLWFISSCNTDREDTFGDELAKVFQQKGYRNFDTTAYFAVFKQELSKNKSQLHNPKWITEFADSTLGMTFISRNLSKGVVDTLCMYLQESDKHGLSSAYFHTNQIKESFEKLNTLKSGKVEDIYPLLAKLDLFATDGYVTYISILKGGAVNPKQLYGRYFEKLHKVTKQQARKALDSTDVKEYLSEVQPKNSYYLKLQQVLQKGGISKDEKENIYLTLEKLRWMGKDFPEKYVVVNIPEQKLRMVDDRKTKEMMNVCVGETIYGPYARRAGATDNHETPVLSGELDRMQVNPVWNIPASIVKKELISSLRSNPNYLESRNMVAYNKKGQMVDPNTVDWSSDSVLNFKFKQNPGADNSLGNIKFIFSNPYSIYLHDTPARQMFSAKNRAVSHGCVRVEKPAALAAFLVNDDKKAEQIASEIADTLNKSRWVMMKKTIPVYITYYTTWIDDEGKIYRLPDIYGYDDRLKKAMKKYYSL